MAVMRKFKIFTGATLSRALILYQGWDFGNDEYIYKVG